jgi:hypothetical protein
LYQVGVCARKIAALPGSKMSSVLDFADNEVFADFHGDDGDEAVIDENAFTGT